jgi:hypothetical protein
VRANPYTGQSAAVGVLELHLTRPRFAPLHNLCTPTVRFRDVTESRPWGVHRYELAAGEYDVRVSVPYLFYEACRGTLRVSILPNHRTQVRYAPSALIFRAAPMRVSAVLALAAERCSFCKKARDDVRVLVSADGAPPMICEECVGACNDMLEEAAPGWKYGAPYPLPRTVWPDLRCAFCGTDQAAKFVESDGGAHVCNLCIVLCNDEIVRHATDVET